MNKYTLFALMMLLAVLMSGCEEYLVTDPNDKIYLDDNFTSSYDIDNAARGMYDGLQDCVEKMFVWSEVRGDLVWPGTGASWEIKELNDLNVSGNNRFTDWSEFYDVINRANYIIKYATKVADNDYNFDDELVSQYVAEAINVRAYTYFWLVRTFGDVPLILEPFDENYKQTKIDTVWAKDGSYELKEMPVYFVDPTFSEVILDTLEAQLARVEGIERTYPSEYSSESTINPAIYSSRFKAITNLVLQADIKLWRNKFKEVITLTNRILDYNPLQYSLGDNSRAPVCFTSGGVPVQRWINIFTAGGSLKPETIFEIRFQSSTPDLNVLQLYTELLPEEGGRYIVRPSQKAIDFWQDDKYYNPKVDYKLDTCDIMRGYNASFIGQYDSINKKWIDPQIFKFLVNGTDGIKRNGFESDCNWIAYRMAEVLCMNCEALNREGNYGEAVRKLQGTYQSFAGVATYGLRSRVLLEEYIKSTDSSPTDKYEPETLILEERAKELAFEGKRWFDLIRIMQRSGQWSYILDEIEMSAPIGKKAAIRAQAENPENWFLPYNENARKFFANPDYQNKTVQKIKVNMGL